jgi:putative hydrolase of the HAD superfamily
VLPDLPIGFGEVAMNQQWIIFDAMGVIFKVGDDTNELLVPFVQERSRASWERINERYLAASLGTIPSRRFWEDVGLGTFYPSIENEYLDSRLVIEPDFLTVAGRLAGRYSIGLLSNDVAEWSSYLRKKHQLGCFTTVIVSGQVGCRKPDQKIYELLLERTGAAPQSCIFVDDRLNNLRTAHELGIRTIHFQRAEGSGEFSPDASITSFSQLENAVRFFTETQHDSV